MKRRTLLSGAALGLAFAQLPHAVAASANARQHKRQYAQPSKSVPIVLPRDHGPHPNFKTEWWYFTGWFTSKDLNEPLGIQITFFRSAPDVPLENPSRFKPGQLLFAHAAVALPSHGKLKHAQIIRRSGSGGVSWESAKPGEQVLNLQMPGWALNSATGEAWHCKIQTPQLGLQMRMQQTQAPWLQGENGFSRKGPDEVQSSHYITLPHLKSSGTLVLDGKTIAVDGEFWMDHEWSSTVLAENAQGWDWVGLHGDRGESLMAFQIRNKISNEPPVWAHGALRLEDKNPQQFESVRFTPLRQWRSTRTGIQYPISQTLDFDNLRLVLDPLMDDQELDARSSTGTLYWEGAVRVKTRDGKPWGRGYLEMTGYDRPMKL